MSISKKDRLRTTALEPISDVLLYRVNGCEVRLYFATIAPLVAERLLDDDRGINRQNRTPNKMQIERFTVDMKAGNWRVTHQGIAIDASGALIDGQHRLYAMVESGTSQTLLVSEGWPAINRVATDHGWMRQLRDDLKIMGITESPKLVSAVLNMIRRQVDNTTLKLGFDEARAEMKKYAGGLRFLEGRCTGSRGNGTLSTTIVSAFVYAQPRATAVLAKCWTDLQEGAGLLSHDPILKLRDECMKPGAFGSHELRVANFHKALNAIYMRLRDRSTKQLKVSDEASTFFAEAYR